MKINQSLTIPIFPKLKKRITVITTMKMITTIDARSINNKIIKLMCPMN